MGQVTVTIREYAGPSDGTAVAPVGITDFLKRRATHNLVEYVGTLLRRDRNKFVDHVVADLLLRHERHHAGRCRRGLAHRRGKAH